MRKIIDINEELFARKYGLSPVAAKLLMYADLNEEQMEDLLSRDNTLLTSRSDCVRQCAELLMDAKKNGVKVFVGGDYDADGITSTAIMKDVLDRLGIANGYYIPDRFREGYGLKPETVEAAVKKGYGLIMTVDNGVSAHEAIARCHELGVPVIVTDHHRIEGKIDADLVVHPDYMEPEFAYLSGAGVALQISRTLFGDVDRHTALCAIALIADVMPLWKQTRRIVRKGLDLLNQGVVPAVSAMVYRGSQINPTAVSFQIVPKLNSVGRMNDMSNVNTLVPFLLSDSSEAIANYARQLDKVNQARRDLSAIMTRQCEDMLDDSPFPILYREDFHEGICGLAAGKLASSCGRPVLVMARSGDLIKGSGRSVPGFDLFAFFSKFDELAAFGGHEQAVGLSVKAEQFDAFCEHVRREMETFAAAPAEEEAPAIRIRSDQMTLENILDVEALEPLPKEAGPALFALGDLVVRDVFRSPKVTRYHFLNDSGGFDGVAFTSQNLPAREPECIVGKVSVNRWKANVIPQIEIAEME
ncbi:MAG: hypothetical protein E7190_08750 [Erysipelotrichaceae bacterium]|nr:hypothetical protein [Erysipelotrichaceae bacterium]